MAVAHSAASESHTGATGSSSQAAFSWTHTQTGTPQGVVVFVSTFASVADLITSVTYGGVALTRLSGGSAQDAAGELGRMDAFFLGSGLGAGNQTITVNRTNNATVMYAAAATVTAGADTAVPATIVLLQGDGTLTVQSVNDTSPGQNSVRYAGGYSGLAAPPAAGTGSTLLNSIDIGNYGSALVRETTAGQGARNVGFNAATDDRAVVHLAIRELVPRSLPQTVASFTLTGNAADLLKASPKSIAADVGTFAITGNPADLRHNPDIEAATGAFALSGNGADLRRNANIEGGTGAFALTGNDATLAEAAPKAITAETGTFALTGNGADLRRNANIEGGTGAFTLTGNDAALAKGRFITADRGQFFLPERNLRRWSESFDNAAWSKGNSSITANATTAPDGTLTADALIENTTQSVSHSVSQNIAFVAGRTYTVSCYCKLYPGPIVRRLRLQLGNATVFGVDTYAAINLEAGTITLIGSPTDSGITSVGNGWYRVWVTKVCTVSATMAPTILLTNATGTGLYTDADGLSGNYIWGAQHEEGSLSDYDPTGPSGATRTDTRHNVLLNGETGSFSFTGNAVTLTKTAADELTPLVGTFTLASNGAALTRNRLLSGNRGQFTLTGQAASLRLDWRVAGDRGQFLLTGNPAALTVAYSLLGARGAFTFTGNPAGLTDTDELDAVAGVFTLTGNNVTLLKSSGRRRVVFIF